MYSYGRSGHTRRRTKWFTALGVAVVLAVLIAAWYLVARGASPQSGEGAQAPAVPPGIASAVPVAEPSESPVASAVAWLSAYRSLRWDDPAPTAWIDRVRPVVTDRQAAEYERFRDGSVGADWQEFVSAQCSAIVDGADGVIPQEAPQTPASVSVQVAGLLRTTCGDESEAMPDEHLAATVVLVKAADGRWLVDRKLY